MRGLNTPLEELPAFDKDSGAVNVIIETPKGQRNKFNYDEEYRLFRLGGLLPLGDVFPFDFGFVPSTFGEDGDPLDIMVLSEEATCVGCLLAVRPIGVIEAEQKEKGKTERNDRLIGVPVESHQHSEIRALKELTPKLLEEIEEFFVSYNKMRGKKFKVIGRRGPKRAYKLIKQAGRNFYKNRSETRAA
jgi:inorganic pyrophosphatase